VLKPAEQTPLTALKFAEWLKAEVPDLPDGVLNIVTGDGETCGNALVRSEQVDKIAFTGGTETGKYIMQAVGQTAIKKVSLELGGKSPHIFFADADIAAAVDGALFGSFVNQGEVCSATSRFLVEEKIYDTFLKALLEQAKKVTLGDPLDPKIKMGPLVTHEHRDRVAKMVEDAKKEGATVALGGKAPDLPGAYYEPTILTGVKPEMKIFKEEVFGPVCTITRFKDETEAIKLANQSAYGLAGAVWSRDIFRALRVMKQLRAGIVWINSSQPCYCEAPWGGFKQSGIGRELGKYGVEEFLESKQVHINLNEAPLGWY
jgi:betaine-aldehyde dehydrogenase